MPRRFASSILAIGVLIIACAGCRHNQARGLPSPTASGLYTRDLVDPVAHDDANYLAPSDQLISVAERLRKERQQKLAEQSKKEGGVSSTKPDRKILCLSGGGSHGAYSAGVLVGWSERGDRPTFDVVTGISTGALIAVPAFLGPKYDDQMTQFYTTLRNKDLFKVKPVRGLFREAFTGTSRLASRIDAFLTADVMQDLAEAHRRGRRLYIGTTEQEGKQFIVWDIGAIACRDGPGGRELINNILLGSSAVPGLFPAAKIPITVDGVPYAERHVDGGVSRALFFHHPHVPPEQRSDVAARDLAGAKVYVIVAGKLFADPEVVRPWSFSLAKNSVATLLHAQTRGDLQQLYTLCLLTGMDYYVSAVPPEYNLELTNVEFDPAQLSKLFEEGKRVILSPTPWRTVPPGFGRGESVLTRAGVDLTYRERGPSLPIRAPRRQWISPQNPVSDRESSPAPLPADR
jgi:predicted acylesterase/phospholipase RssA